MIPNGLADYPASIAILLSGAVAKVGYSALPLQPTRGYFDSTFWQKMS
jgi:hypothetical protein